MCGFEAGQEIAKEKAILRIAILRSGRVEEFAGLFTSLDLVYKHLLVVDIISREAERKSKTRNNEKTISIPIIKNPDDQVQTSERLILHRIQVNSPGFVEILGVLNALKIIRDFINDFHERKKDKEYRKEQERRAGELANESREIENSIRKTELISKQMELLSRYGVPEPKIRDALMNHIERPVDAIEHQSVIGLIGEATLTTPETANKTT